MFYGSWVKTGRKQQFEFWPMPRGGNPELSPVRRDDPPERGAYFACEKRMLSLSGRT